MGFESVGFAQMRGFIPLHQDAGTTTTTLLGPPPPPQKKKPYNCPCSLLLIKQLRHWLSSVSPPSRPNFLLNLVPEHPNIVLTVPAVFKQMLPCLLNILLVLPAGIRVWHLNLVFQIWSNHGITYFQLVIVRSQLLLYTLQFLMEIQHFSYLLSSTGSYASLRPIKYLLSIPLG
jgi:hypothetical protein